MSFCKIFSTLILCCFLTGCGFHPLYTPIRGSSRVAVPVKISTISERNGQILRNYLVDILTPEGPCKKPPYILDITLTETIIDIGIRRDETASRKNAIMTALLTLRDSKTNSILYTHTAKAINSFSIISQNYFSDLTTEEYAKREALHLLAEKISILVITYINSKEDKCHEPCVPK